jgi:hypothetical protein
MAIQFVSLNQLGMWPDIQHSVVMNKDQLSAIADCIESGWQDDGNPIRLDQAADGSKGRLFDIGINSMIRFFDHDYGSMTNQSSSQP